MATNEVLKLCRRCWSFTAVLIDRLDREVLCENCRAPSTVTFDLYTPGQFEAVYGDLRRPPTPEMMAKYMPAPKRRQKRVTDEEEGDTVRRHA
jgi:hypothetical protein